MDKAHLRKLAEETVQFIKAGHYVHPTTGVVYHLDILVHDTQYYGPDDTGRKTLIEVTNQTTLEAARELTESVSSVGVLNFASGKNPGGGFLRGTFAQEESLARSSTLYASLSSATAQSYYELHRETKDPRYSDGMIYSSDVTVFRDDAGNLLEVPYYVNILTAAAPNARALGQQGEKEEELLEQLIDDRVKKIFHIFKLQRCHTLVLGAWGCGVFGNHPANVAAAFSDLLHPATYKGNYGEFAGQFDRVRFAIPDEHGANHQTFREWFDIASGETSVKWGRVF